MSFFALSQLLALAVAASGALGALSVSILYPMHRRPSHSSQPPRFAMTAWDKPGSSAGVRLYGSTPDRSGILELSLNGKLNATSEASFPWNVDFHLLGTAVTAIGSDFAAISTKDGTKLIVFFIRNNGALAYLQSPNATVPTWSLGLVGGSPKPAPSTSLGAAMWSPDHMSVFYQDVEGIILESEFKNGTWAAPADITAANVGTDVHAVAGTDNTKGALPS